MTDEDYGREGDYRIDEPTNAPTDQPTDEPTADRPDDDGTWSVDDERSADEGQQDPDVG